MKLEDIKKTVCINNKTWTLRLLTLEEQKIVDTGWHDIMSEIQIIEGLIERVRAVSTKERDTQREYVNKLIDARNILRKRLCTNCLKYAITPAPITELYSLGCQEETSKLEQVILTLEQTLLDLQTLQDLPYSTLELLRDEYYQFITEEYERRKI